MTRQQLLDDLSLSLIKDLKLENITPEEITETTSLFGDDSDLGLDSLDAVELAVVLEKNHGLSFADTEDARQAFATLGSLADAILQLRAEA